MTIARVWKSDFAGREDYLGCDARLVNNPTRRYGIFTESMPDIFTGGLCVSRGRIKKTPHFERTLNALATDNPVGHARLERVCAIP